ncbi:MAG: NAD(P)-dependent oxidoreductase [Acidimicrobiia bacterium]|nr:NAD(P)-dependent oxidoreductase [Acidimicrobiia bacterium]
MNNTPAEVDTNDAVVVTGGLGFIGSFVADAFLAMGRRVVIIDSMVSSVISTEPYDTNPNCTVLKISVEEYFAQGGGFTGAERVVHAASLVGPAGILRFAGRLGHDIVEACQLVVEECIRGDVPMVDFSSAEVYGRSGQLSETDTIEVPVDYSVRIEYAIAKTLTEAIVANSRHRGLRAIVIRPFNVTGPRQSEMGGFVVPTFVQQALQGDDITVFATGQQLRSFLSVTDLTRFIVEHMDEALESGQLIYNIGNPDNEITVRGLADLVREMTDSGSEVIYADAKKIHGDLYEEAESFQKNPVLVNAPAVGWKPQVDLPELIAETIAYYRPIVASRRAAA